MLGIVKQTLDRGLFAPISHAIGNSHVEDFLCQHWRMLNMHIDHGHACATYINVNGAAITLPIRTIKGRGLIGKATEDHEVGWLQACFSRQANFIEGIASGEMSDQWAA